MAQDNEFRPGRRPIKHEGGGEQLTKQSGREAADANLIWKRYINTGQLPAGNARAPHYDDFSSGVDYHAALEQIRKAEADFEMLPAHIRDYCDNDPANLIDILNQPDGAQVFDDLVNNKPETEADTRQRRRQQPPERTEDGQPIEPRGNTQESDDSTH